MPSFVKLFFSLLSGSVLIYGSRDQGIPPRTQRKEGTQREDPALMCPFFILWGLTLFWCTFGEMPSFFDVSREAQPFFMWDNALFNLY